MTTNIDRRNLRRRCIISAHNALLQGEAYEDMGDYEIAELAVKLGKALVYEIWELEYKEANPSDSTKDE